MKRTESIKLIDIYGQLADLKEIDYKNSLVITALIEILVEKGLIERAQVIEKAQELDLAQEQNIAYRKIQMQ